MPESLTMVQILDDLHRRGFTANLEVVEDALRVVESGQVIRPENAMIREHHRFEGDSNPDDMSIVYAIEGPEGMRGVLVDAFGLYADPAVGAVVAKIREEPPRRDR